MGAAIGIIAPLVERRLAAIFAAFKFVLIFLMLEEKEAIQGWRVRKSHIEKRLYPLRFKILAVMVIAVAINLVFLVGHANILVASFLGHMLFGQAVFSYLCGWRISIGPGIVGNTRYEHGRDIMGLLVFVGFVVMFFFRGY